LVNQGHDVTDDLVMPWEDFTGVGAPVLGSQYKNFKPTSSETNPADRPRNPVFMFISTRPADKVTDEISLVVGYPFKAGTEATAQVGGSSFALYTQQDGAWIKNATEETKMVDTMATPPSSKGSRQMAFGRPTPSPLKAYRRRSN
jgi:hypothetical protein